MFLTVLVENFCYTCIILGYLIFKIYLFIYFPNWNFFPSSYETPLIKIMKIPFYIHQILNISEYVEYRDM